MKSESRPLVFLRSLLSWVFVVPLALLLPKKNRIVFIGRDEGRLLDNVKYLYLYLHRLGLSHVEHAFLTESPEVAARLQAAGLPVRIFPSWRTGWFLLKAQVVVTDDLSWFTAGRFFLLFGARKVQLWHGVGFKKTELIETLPLHQLRIGQTIRSQVFTAITGRYPLYDLLVSTSPFYTTHLFSKAFRSRHILEAGYPRNDVFAKSEPDAWYMLETDVETLSKARQLRSEGFKLVLYVPTYRVEGEGRRLGYDTGLEAWLRFAEAHKIVFIFKFHPLLTPPAGFPQHHPHLLCYHPDKDVYPLLPHVDLLLTDYSSIYTDFLLINKPVVFYPFDYSQSIEDGLQFDYYRIAPGPKCHTQAELLQTLKETLVDGKEEWKEKRAHFRDLSFALPPGEASQIIWAYIQSKWLK